MYILTDEQIRAVEDWLNTFDVDESQKIGKTEAELKELFYPALGDAPFEFEDTFITNPLLTEFGAPLYNYKNACDHYGESAVNNFFAKVLEHRFGIEVKEEKEEIIEAAVDSKISDKPIAEDQNFTIYRFKDVDELDNLVHDEVDIGVTDGDFLLITAKDKVDDDFVSEGDDVYVVDLDSGLCWSNNTVNTIDELKYDILTDSSWAVIDNLLKEKHLYDACGLSGAGSDSTFSTDIRWAEMEDYFKHAHSGRQPDTISGDTCLDVLAGDYRPQIYYEEDFIDDVLDDISPENLQNIADKFQVNKNDIKKALSSKTNFTMQDDIKIYQLVNDALHNCLYNSEYSNLLESILKGIQECFPSYMDQYLELDSDGVVVKNCPKSILSKLMDDYIEELEPSEYLENLYNCNLIDLLGAFIRKNLFIREEYSYQEYNKDEFNDMIDTLLYER